MGEEILGARGSWWTGRWAPPASGESRPPGGGERRSQAGRGRRVLLGSTWASPLHRWLSPGLLC